MQKQLAFLPKKCNMILKKTQVWPARMWTTEMGGQN
jgi:hypothetical protein